MAQIIKTNIEGLDEILAAFNELPIKLQTQVIKALNRKAVKQHVVDNIRNVVNYSSSTEKGIVVTNDRSDRTAVIGGPTSDVFWIRFADRGTVARYTEKGAYRGQIVGKNQIEPIIMGSVDNIIEYMNTEMGAIIKEILEKRIKSTAKKLSQL